MQPLRLRPVWLACGGALLMLVVVLSLMPIDQAGPSDKLNHVIAYFTLMAWFGALYARRQHLIVMAGLVLLGLLLEGLQGLTAYRQPSIADCLANTTGVVLAWLLVGMRIHPLLYWLEAHVMRQNT